MYGSGPFRVLEPSSGEALAEADTVTVCIPVYRSSPLFVAGVHFGGGRHRNTRRRLGSILRGRRGISAFSGRRQRKPKPLSVNGSGPFCVAGVALGQSQGSAGGGRNGNGPCIRLGSILRDRRGSSREAPAEAESVTVPVRFGLRGRRDGTSALSGRRPRKPKLQQSVCGSGPFCVAGVAFRQSQGGAGGGRIHNGPYTVLVHSAWQTWHFETLVGRSAGGGRIHNGPCIRLGSILRGRRGTLGPLGGAPGRPKRQRQ